MSGWKPSALIGLVMIFPSLIFFALFGLRIAPTFAKMFSELGSVPLPSHIAAHPMTSVSIIGFLLCGMVGGVVRPNERFLILPLVAATGFVLSFAAMVALYLPMWSVAAAIR